MKKNTLHECLSFLTYDYGNYSAREKVYSQILKQFDPSLRNTSTKTSSFVEKKYTELQQLGFTKLQKIDDTSLIKIIGFIQSHLRPTKNKFKRDAAQDILMGNLELLKLFTSHRIVRPIQSYLGIFPSLHSVSGWEVEGTVQLERTPEMYWHMDHHGHKFIKVFYYLTDTELGFGHHEYIQSSHSQPIFDNAINTSPLYVALRNSINSKRQRRGSVRISDDTVLPLSKSICRFVGKAGTGFMEDTRGLHRGTVLPPSHKRLIIQALYLPIDSGKDPTYKLSLPKDYLRQIKLDNEYTVMEMKKLFMLIKLI